MVWKLVSFKRHALKMHSFCLRMTVFLPLKHCNNVGDAFK